ncbi:MAG: T9SS type A sorting domain-containing protein [Bacteroidota bacterium]
MRYFLIMLICWPSWLGAQNNPIFGGGNEDGQAVARQNRQDNNPIFAGGREDGHTIARINRESNNLIFLGGTDDGYSVRRLSRPNNNPIFEGGREDGFAERRIAREANNSIFAGGSDDGYDRGFAERKSHNDIFEGGIDDGYDQFRIIGIPPSVNPNLPVEILGFEAWWEEDVVQLYWLTTNEDNLAHFEVERSTDASLYQPILRQPAIAAPQSIQEYTDQDPEPLWGRSYYRLKAVDFDGSLTYSPVVSLYREASRDWQLLVYPNPTVDQVQVSLRGQWTSPPQLVLTDLVGKELSVPRSGYQNDTELNASLDLSRLPSGLYLLTVWTSDGQGVMSQKIYKQ